MDDRIELKSEKVRRLVGTVPPSLVRWGIGIIVGVFAALAAAVCLIPYPYGQGETIVEHIMNPNPRPAPLPGEPYIPPSGYYEHR